MEALFILVIGLVEAISLLVPALVSIAMGVVGLVAELFSLLLNALLNRAPKRVPKERRPKQSELFKKIRPSAWIKPFLKNRGVRIVLGALSVLFVTLCIFIALIETIWFEPAIRKIANLQQQRTHITITFDAVEGSLLKRYVHFQNLQVSTPQQGDQAGFDLQCQEFEVDILGHPLSKPNQVGLLKVQGFSGDVHMPAQKEEPERKAFGWKVKLKKEKDQLPEAKIATSKDLKRRPFVVRNLEILHCKLNLHKGALAPIPLSIAHWTAEELDSRALAFGILFRSNFEGSFGESSIAIRCTPQERGRRTEWEIQQLSAQTLAAFSPLPWKYFEAGHVDISVFDDWHVSEKAFLPDHILMDWNLTVTKPVLRPSPDDNPMVELALGRLQHKIDAQMGTPLHIGFKIDYSPVGFEGSMSDALRAMVHPAWNALKSALMESVLNEKADQGALAEDTQKAFEWMKNKLNKNKAP